MGKKIGNILAKKQMIFIAGSVVMLLFPVLIPDYYLTILITANIYAILAASWDLLGGVTGQFSLGQALFFGAAAYISGALNLYLGLAPWMTIPIGGVFGVIVGFLVALPSLRLKGVYFTITSLIFPGILGTIILMNPGVTGGDSILSGLSSISSEIAITYYVSLLLMLASIFVLLKITSSNMGLIFRSIRDDEDAAEAIGINTTKYKFYSFAISGFFAGIAGGFQAHLLMLAGPSMFNAFISLQAILFAALGGIGTIIGSVGGAYLMSILNEIFRDIAEFRVIITAIVMLIVFRFLPEGLLGAISKRLRLSIGFWSGLNKLRRLKGEFDS